MTRDNAAAAGIALPDYKSFREGPPIALRPMLAARWQAGFRCI